MLGEVSGIEITQLNLSFNTFQSKAQWQKRSQSPRSQQDNQNVQILQTVWLQIQWKPFQKLVYLLSHQKGIVAFAFVGKEFSLKLLYVLYCLFAEMRFNVG